MFKIMKLNKNIFLYLYIFCAVAMNVFRLVMGIFDEDILGEVLLLNFKAYLFASFEYVESYLMTSFDGIGFFVIPLIIYFSLSIRGIFIEMFMEKNDIKFNISHIIVPTVGVGCYLLFRLFLKTTMPFSLLEGILFASITYPTVLIIKK